MICFPIGTHTVSLEILTNYASKFQRFEEMNKVSLKSMFFAFPCLAVKKLIIMIQLN